MQVLIDQQLCKLEWLQADLLAEEKSDGMTEHFAHPPGVQLPGIASPHFFGLIATDQLTDDGIDPTPFDGQPTGPGLAEPSVR